MKPWSTVARRIRVPVGFAFAVLYFWLARPALSSILAGAGIAVAGLVVRGLASGHVRKNEMLTTTGLYAYTRNPLYLGSLIMAAGFAVAARSGWIVGVLVVFFFAIYLPVIRSEEKFLREHFPEYADYARRVPRLLPRLRAPDNGGAFSWDLYWKHREYNAAFGAAAMMAALVAKLVWF